MIKLSPGKMNMKNQYILLVVITIWMGVAFSAKGVTTNAAFHVSYQRIVPLSYDCSAKESTVINVRPLLPTTNITANVLTVASADDRAVISVPGGSSATRSSGGPCIGANLADVDIKALMPTSKDGAFTITLSDFTSTNVDNVNQIEFSGDQVVTYDVAAPLPPAISDANVDEQVCSMRYDECEKRSQTVCWYQSAGCPDCSSLGSPRVSFGLANFNVKVEDTPIWHETAVGEPLALKMRYSNFKSIYPVGTFGYRWSCNWNSSVTVLDSETNQVVFPSGSIGLFTQSVANVYLPSEALEGTLVKTNGMFRYAQLDGWTWDYAQSTSDTNLYLLSAVRDAWSNTVSVTYTSNDRLDRVQQTVPDTGRYLEFSYNDATRKATSVALRSSATDLEKVATFSYTGYALLSNVVDMGGNSYSYEYDSLGYLLTRVKKGESDRMVVSYSEDPFFWTATSSYWVQMTDAEGYTRKYTWLFGLVQEVVTFDVASTTNYYSVSTAGSRGRVLTGAMENGNQQQYQYNARGRVTNRTDRTGAQWRQTYNTQNRLLTLTDPLSNKTTNVYAANGVDLLYVQQPIGPAQRVFTYVANKHAAATESNALGLVITNSYNSLGLVTNTADGRVTNEFSYDGEGRLVAHLRNGELVATNQYDAFGRLYWTRDAAGLETWRNYDGLNRLVFEIFDNNGQWSTNVIEYDCCSIDRITDRDGNKWDLQYNDIGKIVQAVNPAGLTNDYVYGIEGQPRSVSNALHWTTRQYTPEGWIKSVAYPTDRPYDPNYHAENFWYDGEGRLTKQQAVSGAYFRYGYDSMGRLLTAEVPDGSNLAFGVEQYVLAETNKYDALGRNWWTKDIRGLVTSNTFNSLGQVLKTWYPDASAEEWSYNQWGQVLTYKDRAGNVASNFYDGQGRLWRQTDARLSSVYLVYTNADLVSVVSNSAGQVWNFAYDAERRVREIVHPDPAVVETFAYSPMGSVTQHVVGNVVQTLSYDGLEGRTSVRVGGAVVESNRYDKLGRLIWRQDADNLIVTNAWDSWGERKSSYGPGNQGESYQHGARGLTNIADRLGIPTSILRDSLGRVTGVLDGATNPVSYAFWSNGVNQLRYLWDGNSNRTSWAYDIYGNPASRIYANSTSNRFQYSRLNLLTNKIDAANVLTRYAYDANGNLKTIVPGNNSTISFEYDALNQPTNMTDGVGITRWAYDSMGRMQAETGPFGTVVSNSYDDLGRLTGISFAGLYWIYEHDDLDRITGLVAPEGAYAFTYLAQGGRRTSVLYPNGVTESNSYDSWIRVTNLAWMAGGSNLLSVGYVHDAGGRRTNEVWGSGRRLAYAYDRAYQLTNAASTNQASDNFDYSYDKAGNPLVRRESGLGVTNVFSNLNQIVSGSWTGGTVTVAGAVNYNAGTVTVNGAVASRSGLFYERTNVSLSLGTNLITAVYAGPSFGGGVATAKTSVVVGNTTYGRDANGNLTNDANFAYRYDALSRLTNVLIKTNGVSMLANRYDGLGRRLEAVRSGTNTERYVYVPGTFLVLAVLDATNGVKEIVTHGPDLSGAVGGAGSVGGILAQTTGTNVCYLHSDAAGNVVLATDPSRQVVATIHYAPFGKPIAQAGPFHPRFLFSSKEWEASVGLYYYGYRFYSPQLGRWLSRDPLGEFADPLHNLYRFVGNNPLNAVDPDGLVAWGQVGRGAVGVIANGALTVGGAALSETGVGAAVAMYGAYQTGANFGNMINGFFENGEGPSGPVQAATQVGMLVGGVDSYSRTWARGDIAAQTVDILIPTVLSGRIDTRLVTRPAGPASSLLGTLQRVYIPPEQAYGLVRAGVLVDQGIMIYDYGQFSWDEYNNNDKDDCQRGQK